MKLPVIRLVPFLDLNGFAEQDCRIPWLGNLCREFSSPKMQLTVSRHEYCWEYKLENKDPVLEYPIL